MNTKIKKQKSILRKKRVRAKIYGTANQPRLSVFRSNRYIYAQIIDDEKGKTLVGLGSDSGKKSNKKEFKKIEQAKDVGERLATAALEKGIKKIVFDRSSYAYHGRVKALAEGARAGGLEF